MDSVYLTYCFIGMKELVSDKLTEHPDTINILARMNVYQEVILAFLYRTLGLSVIINSSLNSYTALQYILIKSVINNIIC